MLNILSTPSSQNIFWSLFSSNNTTMGSVGIITTTSWLYENYGDILILIDFLPQKHIILVKIWFCSGHMKNKNACNEATISHCKIPQFWKKKKQYFWVSFGTFLWYSLPDFPLSSWVDWFNSNDFVFDPPTNIPGGVPRTNLSTLSVSENLPRPRRGRKEKNGETLITHSK